MIRIPDSHNRFYSRSTKLWDKLFPFLAISKEKCLLPFRVDGSYRYNWNGLTHFQELPNNMGQNMFRVRWMPKLFNDYRRLTFEEFCDYYKIKML